MFIKELKVSNFKKFAGDQPPLVFNLPNGKPGSGLNVFVGENNTGKSTVLETIDFLRNGTKKSDDVIKNKTVAAEAIVEVLFEGDINGVIDAFSQPNKIDVFKRYVFGDLNNQIKLRRDTADSKTIQLWSAEEGKFKNESGIDAPTKKLFETNFVWADTNPNDEAAFGASTICGNLLKEISRSVTDTAEYKKFTEAFHRTFNSEDSALKTALRQIERHTEEIFQEQFGRAGISFRFDEVKTESFFKNTIIDIDDGVRTAMTEKGSGMQRAVALAMLQVYAAKLVKHPENDQITKPFFLFVDEPEVCLHPKAQEKLLSALLEISKTKQVFLTTHSPFFIATKELHRMGLFIFKKEGEAPSITRISGEDKLLPWSPTWGEINFKAYGLATVDFHNELYGRLQEVSKKWKVENFDEWLENQGLNKTKQWTKEHGGVAGATVDVSLQTFIRNKIHHPENATMKAVAYSSDELHESIYQMISLITGNSNAIVGED